MKYLLFILLLSCKAQEGKVKEFSANGGTTLELGQMKNDKKYANFFKFLQDPEASDALSKDVQVISYGGGSCPLAMLGQESAPGRGCTYGTTAHARSGANWSESADYTTGWGYSPPNNANPKFSPIYASLAAKLNVKNSTSLNLSENTGRYNYEIKLYSSVTQTLGSKAHTMQDVLGIKLQDSNNNGAVFNYYIAASGAVMGVVTSVSAVWNGSEIAASNGDTGEVGFMRTTSSASSSSSGDSSTSSQDASTLTD